MAKSRSKRRSRSSSSSGAGSSENWVVQPGTPVYTSDDKQLGAVTDITDGHLVVHKGGLFAKDYRVPFSAISAHTDERIDLDVTTDEAGSGSWRGESAAAHAMAQRTDRGEAVDAVPMGEQADVTAQERVTPVEGFETLHVPVVEEQLEATRRTVERGAVQVVTTVSEHEETLAVPVVEETVHIQRIAVDRLATAADLAVNARTLDVPIYGEEVDLSKRARVVEEIEISKEGVRETRELTDTVRREDVEVVDGTDVIVSTRAGVDDEPQATHPQSDHTR